MAKFPKEEMMIKSPIEEGMITNNKDSKTLGLYTLMILLCTLVVMSIGETGVIILLNLTL